MCSAASRWFTTLFSDVGGTLYRTHRKILYISGDVYSIHTRATACNVQLASCELFPGERPFHRNMLFIFSPIPAQSRGRNTLPTMYTICVNTMCIICINTPSLLLDDLVILITKDHIRTKHAATSVLRRPRWRQRFVILIIRR